MGRYKEDPRYNVISLRMTDEERAMLEELVRCNGTNISDLMRAALFAHAESLKLTTEV
ncbi:MAG: ribbon-helix-helix protein, CopG family [Desulfuromonadales bacterium]|nr:MAG: ribbon-helix-helix protein, CopG family [Desulfuromonadales bacterium]